MLSRVISDCELALANKGLSQEQLTDLRFLLKDSKSLFSSIPQLLAY